MFELRAKTWLNVAEVKARVEKAKIEPLEKCALMIEAEAKRLLSKGGKGIGTAKLGDKKAPVTYRASTPGQPPFLRTGNLRASIKSAKTSSGTFVVGPTTTAFYGRVHEFGANIQVTAKMRGFLFHQFGWRVKKASIYIPPRPFMRPALNRVMSRFPEKFKNLPLGGNIGPAS